MLETPRLLLRPRRPADADALHPAYADVDAMRYWSGPPHTDIEETRASLARPDNGWRMWIVADRATDAAMGFVSAFEKRQGKVSEIGYLIGRPFWGSGIAAEAVSAVIEQILVAEGQRRIFADTDPENAASRGLLERLGFRLEGMLRAEWETHIGIRDTALYGLLASEWHRAR